MSALKSASRVDANQGCNLTEYLQIFRKMEAYNLEFIEQPLPVWEVDGYQKLCAALDTLILIDKGVYTPHDLTALIKRDAVDVINIKILKTGLRGGKRISVIAESAGRPCLVGSMFETSIDMAASLHFAISTRNVTHASECMFPSLLVDDEPYSIPSVTCAWGVPHGVGAGVELKVEVNETLS